jgi:ubiquitin-like-conjugating enzyme ATG10
LPLDRLVESSLFHKSAFEGTEKSTFGLAYPMSNFPLLSQGDHPILGTPCWYLHPCETVTAVEEILSERTIVKEGVYPLAFLEAWFTILSGVVDLRAQ